MSSSRDDDDDIDHFLEAESLRLHDVTRSDVDEASEMSDRSAQRPRFGHPPNVRVRTLAHNTAGAMRCCTPQCAVRACTKHSFKAGYMID